MERLPFLYGNPYRIKRFPTDRTGERGGSFPGDFLKNFWKSGLVSGGVIKFKQMRSF